MTTKYLFDKTTFKELSTELVPKMFQCMKFLPMGQKVLQTNDSGIRPGGLEVEQWSDIRTLSASAAV